MAPTVLELESTTPPDRSPTHLALRRLALIASWWCAFAIVQQLLFLITWTQPSFPMRMALQPARVALVWTLITPALWGWLRLLDAAQERARGPRARAIIAVTGHLAGIVMAGMAETTSRRIVAYATGGWPVMSFWMATLYFIDFTALAYLALVITRRVMQVQDLLTRESRRELLLRAQVAQARRTFLEAQMRPHFLFNSLGTISELCFEAPAAAARMLRQLASLLRFALVGFGGAVRLDEELEALEAYLDIQRVRFSDWLVIEQRIAPDARSVLVPRLTLQPLVENAIRHGLAGRTELGHILITAEVVGDDLHVTVRDNGTGLRARDQMRGYGIGLTNMRGRLATLYGDRYRFTLSEAHGGGAIAELVLPVDCPVAEQAPVEGELAAAERLPFSRIVGWVRRHPILATSTAWFAWGSLWLQQMIALMLLDHEEIGSIPRLVWGYFLAVLIWALLTPVIVRIARWVPFQGRGRWLALLHVPLACACSLGQNLLWHFLLKGKFVPLSEGSITGVLCGIMAYICIIGITQYQQLLDWLREREVAAARLQADVEESRLRAATLQAQPERVLRVLEQLADEVVVDSERTERALSRLADSLRQSLEESLVPETALAGSS
jgi:two-component system LytT family sensor kinase